jgi:O-acetylhomoserine/O-acetylserine sulfhydrylase-like pyridoxal-dependent enzyme
VRAPRAYAAAGDDVVRVSIGLKTTDDLILDLDRHGQK